MHQPSGGGDEGEFAADHAARVDSARGKMIASLVSEGPASVRLRNSVERAAREETMPCRTVGDYVEAGDAAPPMFMGSLSAFGMKTAKELDNLVADYLGRLGLDRASFLDEGLVLPRAPSPEYARAASLAERLDGLTYRDALVGQPLSVRLNNALAGSHFLDLSVADYLRGGESVRAELLRKPNLGRKSLVELEEALKNAVIRLLVQQCADAATLLDDCAFLFSTPDAERIALGMRIVDVLSAGPPRSADLVKLLEWAMEDLDDRSVAILHRRYGFGSGVVETLEEISETYDVTRERVRQIEAKAIRKLAAKLEGHPLVDHLKSASERFWDERGTAFLPAHDSHQIRRELPCHLALALDIAGISLADWLAQNSTAMRFGFIAASCDRARVEDLGARLCHAAAERPLPFWLGDLIEPASLDLVPAAICVETELALSEGYLVAQRPRPRVRRMIRLHRLLAGSGRALTLYELGNAYRAKHDDDDCSLRDIDIVMEIAPHLFLEIEDGLWIAVGGARDPKQAPALFSCEAPCLREGETIDPQTIAGSLQCALRERGPSAVGDLYRDAATILEKGRSRNSVAPVLVSRPELFLRILPGVFALPEHRLDEAALLEAPLPFLLNEAQARSFAFGRKAGEPWGTYRLWNPAAEFRLCLWARHNAPEPLFRSLLSVASIETWPVTSQLRDDWRRLKAFHGRFELFVAGRAPDPEPRPALDRLLAACRLATDRRTICWLNVNRMMGRRLDAAGGQGLLALLIALGCVSLPLGTADEQVLLGHAATSKAADVAVRCSEELLLTGALDWESALGEALLAEALGADPASLGWVSQEQLMRIFGDVAAEPRAADVPPEDEDDDDLFARLMREHRRGTEQARRDAAAAWLLEE